MTVETLQTPITFTVAAEATYALPGEYHAASDFTVFLSVDGGDVWQPLKQESDYAISPEGPAYAGGTLSLLAAQPDGALLFVRRDTVPFQEFSPPQTARPYERALDRLAMAVQDTQDRAGLALRVPAYEPPLTAIPTIARRSGRIGGYDTFGRPAVSDATLAEIGAVIELVRAKPSLSVDDLISIPTTVAASGMADLGQIPPGYEIRTRGYDTEGDERGTTFRVEAVANPLNPLGGRLRPLDFQIDPLIFGAAGDGNTDDVLPIRAAVAFLESKGGGDLLVTRFHAVSDTIVITKEISIIGFGFDVSRWTNYTTDKTVLRAGGSGTTFAFRNDFFRISRVGIRSHAPTQWAVILEDTADYVMDQFWVIGEDTGAKGVLLGGEELDDINRPIKQAYLGDLRKLYVDGFLEENAKISSGGTVALFYNPTIRPSGDGSIGLQTSIRNSVVLWGQIGTNKFDATGLYDYNPRGGRAPGGFALGNSVEASPGRAFVADGLGAIEHTFWGHTRFSDLMSGIGYQWLNARYGTGWMPYIDGDPDDFAGTLAHWGPTSLNCVLYGDAIAARCPMFVDPGATGATLVVHGPVTDRDLRHPTKAVIKRADNLTVLMPHGHEDAPVGYTVGSRNSEYNFFPVTLANDGVAAIPLPNTRCHVTVVNDAQPLGDGMASVDTLRNRIARLNGADSFTAAAGNLTAGDADGVDGHVNLGVSDGVLILKNRLGNEFDFKILISDFPF